MKKIKKCYSKNNLIQISIIFFLMYIFCISAVIYTGLSTGSYRRKLVILSGASIIALILICLYIKKIIKVNIGKKIISVVKCYKYLIVVLLISLLIRLPQLGTPMRWDAQVYYGYLMTACDSFDFTLEAFWNGFRFAGHPSFAYVFLSAIFEFLYPKSMVSVEIFQILLALLAIFTFYKIFQKILKCSDFQLALATLIVSCSPMFLGTVTYYHLDFGIAVLTIFLVGSHLYKKYIMLIFSIFLLLFTKEIGIVVLFGYFSFYYLTKLITIKGNIFVKLKSIFRDPSFYIMAVLGIIGAGYLIYTLFIQKIGWGTVEVISDASEDLVASPDMIGFFAFQKSYIIFKIKQLFTTNFIWLSIAIMTLLFLIKLFMKNKVNFLKNPYIIGIFGAVLLTFIFYCVYITYPLLRYNLVIEVCVNLVLSLFILSLPSKKFKYLLSCILIILFVGQAYLTIDPVMKQVNQRVETGQVPLVLSYPDPMDYFGDYMLYNYQYSYVDKGLRKILDEINYDEDTDVILCGDLRALFIGGNPEVPYKLKWNKSKEIFTYQSDENSIEITTKALDDLDELYRNGQLKKSAVVIYIPYYQVDKETSIEKLRMYYETGKLNKIDIGIYGSMEYVYLNLK